MRLKHRLYIYLPWFFSWDKTVPCERLPQLPSPIAKVRKVPSPLVLGAEKGNSPVQSNPRLFSVRARDEGMRNETANSRLKIGKRAQHCLVSLATSFSRLRHSPDRSEKKNQEISYINFLVVDVKFASSTVVKKKNPLVSLLPRL